MDSQQLNRIFLETASTQEGLEKLAEVGGTFIRDHLLEESFMRKIIPPQNIDPSKCQRSTKNDTLTRIVDIEPSSTAMAVNIRGRAKAELIRGARYAIPFFPIHSQRYNKVEEELLAYEMPITKIMEEHAVKDIQTIEDREGLNHIETCIQAKQLEVNAGAAVSYNRTNVLAAGVVTESVVKGELSLTPGGGDDFEVRALQRPDIVKLKQLLDQRYLKGVWMLMSEYDFSSIGNWTIEDMGDKVGEVTVEGYKANTLMGLKFIRTVKADILRPGNVYLFTDPDFFGRFYILNNTKFWINKEVNVIKWESWETIGMGIGNIAAVRKLELYRGSVTPTAQDVGYAARVPKAEKDLEFHNNRIDERGGGVPLVSPY